MPSSASESPRRSPTRSSRDTNTQLVAKLTTAPTAKARTEGPTFMSARAHRAAPKRRCVARYSAWVNQGGMRQLPTRTVDMPTRLPGSPLPSVLLTIGKVLRPIGLALNHPGDDLGRAGLLGHGR